MSDYTRGDDPAYNSYRETWAADREHELESRVQEQEGQLDELYQDFVDYVCSGIANPYPYCANARQECDAGRGWCRQDKCIGFRPRYSP